MTITTAVLLECITGFLTGMAYGGMIALLIVGLVTLLWLLAKPS